MAPFCNLSNDPRRIVSTYEYPMNVLMMVSELVLNL